MNRTRHSRTYPWRRPLRWLWLALALAASGVMVVHMPAGMGAGGSGKARTAMKPAGESTRETQAGGEKTEAAASSPAPPPKKSHHSRNTQVPETGAGKILARLPQIGSLIGLVAVAAFIGGIAEIFRWHLALGKLFGGLARWAHLPEIISLSIPTALYSNAAANGMLVSSHAKGKITHSNLIAGGMVNSYLSYVSHSLRVAYPVIGAVGLPAICYFGWQMGFGFLFIAAVLFLHRRKSPAAVPDSGNAGAVAAAEHASPEWRTSLRQTCLRVLALVFRMLCLTVPLMIGVEWLMKNGLFSWWEEHVPDWVNRIFPAELMSIVAAQTEDTEYSRILIVVSGDDRIVRQVDKQLSKLIDIVQVDVLEREKIVEREHLLLKVERTLQTSEKLVEIANIFHANILNVEPDSMILELTGDAGTINSFIELYNPYNVLRILRTGAMAMPK